MVNFATSQNVSENGLFCGQTQASAFKSWFLILAKDLYKLSEQMIVDCNPPFAQNEAKMKSGNFA